MALAVSGPVGREVYHSGPSSAPAQKKLVSLPQLIP